MRENPLFVIALYIPDHTARVMNEWRTFQEVVDGTGLDFLTLGWWENAYTARLMVLAPQDGETDA